MSRCEHTRPVPRRSSALRVAGLDLGSTHLKAVCVDLEPGAAAPVTLRSLRRASTPPTAEDLVATALRLLDDVVADGGAVAAIGIASMAETGAPLDEKDEPLTPLLRWDATRPGDVVDRLAERIAPAELFARTGVRLSTKVPLATWAWLATAHPGTWARMRRWAGVADLVGLALTGRLATDHTLAGRTGAYALGSDRYDDELLGLVGLDAAALPEVLAPGRPVGRSDGIPVAIAGHDHQVGAHACGVRAPGDVANSLGTAEVVLRVLGSRPDPERVRVADMSLVRTVGGREQALLASVGATGGTYAAWLASPEPRATGHAQLLEQLCAQTRRAYDAQLALDPVPPSPVTLFGGPGARNPEWTRIKAASIPAGIRVVQQEEPVAVGAAVVGAERAGLIAPGAVTLAATPITQEKS
jgi:xylulokinase